MRSPQGGECRRLHGLIANVNDDDMMLVSGSGRRRYLMKRGNRIDVAYNRLEHLSQLAIA